MSGICTDTVSPNSCGHRILTVTLDGTPIQFHLDETEAQTPLTPDELALFVRLGSRRLRQQGATLAQFLNRVTNGDEATNVKTYNFFGPGLAILKTNIGPTYINVLPGINGEPVLIDFTGCTDYRLLLHANLVGTGPHGVRVIRNSDNAILIENANLAATGERELDTDWTPLPAAFLGQGQLMMRVQAKSVTAQDDPTYRQLMVALK